jgi:hypothetical protein
VKRYSQSSASGHVARIALPLALAMRAEATGPARAVGGTVLVPLVLVALAWRTPASTT